MICVLGSAVISFVNQLLPNQAEMTEVFDSYQLNCPVNSSFKEEEYNKQLGVNGRADTVTSVWEGLDLHDINNFLF